MWELQKSLLNDPVLCKTLSIELRNMQGDDNGLGTMELDIHLHDISLLKTAIEQLKKEDLSFLLHTLIEKKLKENPQNTFTLAAKNIINELITLERFKKISPCAKERILYLTHNTLLSPTPNNLEVCQDFIKKNEHGKANWWKIISGAFIAFVGFATFAVGLCFLPMSPFLSIIGLALFVEGCYLGFQGRTMGLSRSLSEFFKAATQNSQIEEKPSRLHQIT